MTELTKLISEQWNDLDEKSKRGYLNQIDDLKAQYEADLNAWMKKNKCSPELLKEMAKRKKVKKSKDDSSKHEKKPKSEEDKKGRK
jgi:hypothetical protein